MEFKMKLKTRKDLEKEYPVRKSKLKGGEPLADDLRNTVKHNSVAKDRFK